MDNKNLIIIIIISIWIISVIIAGILALIFKEKFKNLKKFNIQKIDNLKKIEINFNLKEIEINYELPKNEICYFFKENIKAYKINIKNKQIKETFKKGVFNFNIYITNKRILFETNEEYIQYPISDLENYFNCSIYFQRKWINAIYLYLKEDRLLLENDENFNLFLTIEKLKKGN